MKRVDGKHKLKGAVLLVMGTTAVLLFSACSTGFGSYCSQARLCEGGNDTDEHNCNAVWSEREQNADLHNCDTEYDDYADCYFANARCNNSVYAPDQKLCASQAARYARCTGS